MPNESKKLSDYLILAIMAYLFIAAIVGLLLVIKYPTALRVFKADEGTDFPVLLITAVTLIAAAITVWISWRIKKEATIIGDNIITNSVMQRHLDRILHEYSTVIRSTYSVTKDEKEFPLLAAVNTSSWALEQPYFEEEKIYEFFKQLMPGKQGHEFQRMVNFKELIDNFKQVLGVDNKYNKIMERLAKQNLTLDEKNKVMSEFKNIGSATFMLLKAFGWKLDYSEFQIEFKLDNYFQTRLSGGKPYFQSPSEKNV